MQFLRESLGVTVMIGPFLDETDNKTPETALAIAQADVRICKVFEANGNTRSFAETDSAAAAVHDENGYYKKTLAPTDVDNKGRLILSVQMAGALPVLHEYTVMSSNVFDSLIADNDTLNVELASSAAGSITAATFAANAITAASIAAGAVNADALATDAVAEISDGVWDEARAGHTAAGSFGQGVASVVGSAGSVTGAVGSVTGAVGSVIGNVGGDVAGDVTSLTAGALNAVADAIWDEARAGHAAAGTFGEGVGISDITAALANKIADHLLRRTFANAAASANGDAKSFRSLLGAVAKQVNKVAIVASTLSVFEADDTTALGTQAVTTTPSADPITEVDTV